MGEVESEIIALIKVWLQALVSLTYTFFIVSKLPFGKIRLFALFPIFYHFTILPLSLSTPIIVGFTALFFTWLANFKLILFSFNLGPLSQHLPKNSLLAFILVGAFPIRVKQIGCHQFAQTNNNVSTKFGLGFWSRLLIYSLIVVGCVYSTYNRYVYPKLFLLIYPCMIYLLLEIILGICKKFVSSIVDLELLPPFNEPLLSTSLQAFWGRRWNLAVSDALRHTIYFPMRAICEVYIGKRWAQYLAMVATFVVSGLMHELIIYYITHASPTFEQTRFFLFQGVFVVVELGLKRAFGMRKLHWTLSVLLTIGLLLITGYWLFTYQLMKSQVFVYF